MRGRLLAAEAMGTFFLVLIGPGAASVEAAYPGTVGPVGVALAFGAVVTAMGYAIGGISGAHINPAVTISLWSVGRHPRAAVVPYIAAQCAGAAAAAATLRLLLGSAVGHAATVPAIALPGAFTLEWLLSFGLMIVIMAVATGDRVAGHTAPIAVGLTVGFCALMGGPLTGASMNPARTFGPAVAAGVWRAHWLYWLAPISGMVIGAWASEWLWDSARAS